MVLDFTISEELKEIIKKLVKKEPKRAEILHKKIHQIINSDEFTIEHYKNLKSPKQNLKRVHIDKSFVLVFHYDKEKKTHFVC
ncbi:MAG: addiction module toxin RelE [Candidatus Diapherotrites archaeon]|nr:addiction module toxin RelE [Candidatus Diapherotrites archaeon]